MKYLLIILLLISSAAFAQGQSAEHRKYYGKGQPKTAQDLPPGQLRKALEALPPKARGKALGQLQAISFPAQDVETLRVDPDGGILYVDPVPDLPESAPLGTLPIDPVQLFLLHSRPGSTNIVFLDFDGHIIEGTAWNRRADRHEALCYDPSMDGCEYSAEEQSRIYNIWQRIAEDYASFNIDVTTQEPVFTLTTGRILFTPHLDAEGICIYYCGAGGAGYVDAWGKGEFYQPALVYVSNLPAINEPNRSGVASYSAEAGSHELGHNLGLTHDGTVPHDDEPGKSYWYGQGENNNLVSVAAIMGASYIKNVTKFLMDEYQWANNPQDDLAIIEAHLGYAPDTDGIINGASDIDTFYIDAEKPGTLTVNITPAWGKYETPVLLRRGSNLDVTATLTAPDGIVTAFNETDDTQAAISTEVVAGRYILNVTGSASALYSTYGSQGRYTIETNLDYDPDPPDPPDPNQPPEAVITYTPDVLEYRKGPGLAVTFDGTDSTDSDGQIVLYRWVLDGQYASGNGVFTATLKKGGHNIGLTVTDDDGDKGLTAIRINVVRVKGKP